MKPGIPRCHLKKNYILRFNEVQTFSLRLCLLRIAETNIWFERNYIFRMTHNFLCMQEVNLLASFFIAI